MGNAAGSVPRRKGRKVVPLHVGAVAMVTAEGKAKGEMGAVKVSSSSVGRMGGGDGRCVVAARRTFGVEGRLWRVCVVRIGVPLPRRQTSVSRA